MVVIFAIRLEKVFFLSFQRYDAHLLKKKLNVDSLTILFLTKIKVSV